MAKPCPDCVTKKNPDGTYTYGSDTSGYKTSSDMNIAKKKHQAAYPKSWVAPTTPTPSPNPKPTPTPKKKGGPITALDQVQRMYSKKKK